MGVNHRLRGVLQGDVLYEPLIVRKAFLASLERIGAKIEELGEAHLREWLAPNVEPHVALFIE